MREVACLLACAPCVLNASSKDFFFNFRTHLARFKLLQLIFLYPFISVNLRSSSAHYDGCCSGGVAGRLFWVNTRARRRKRRIKNGVDGHNMEVGRVL